MVFAAASSSVRCATRSSSDPYSSALRSDTARCPAIIIIASSRSAVNAPPLCLFARTMMASVSPLWSNGTTSNEQRPRPATYGSRANRSSMVASATRTGAWVRSATRNAVTGSRPAAAGLLDRHRGLGHVVGR